MNKNWEKFWHNYRLISINNDNDLLYQVGKTVAGEVIKKKQFNILIDEICMLLNLKNEDNVLDLCCGNGIITYELAKKVNHITGVDFSETFIENAKKHKSNFNINFLLYDVKKLNEIIPQLKTVEFNKIIIYDALAYFNADEINKLLKTILELFGNRNFTILFASILDKNKRWNFFNTFFRKINYFINIKLFRNNKGLGKWWTEKEILAICKANKLYCKIYDQNKLLYTSHYRINAVIKNE